MSILTSQEEVAIVVKAEKIVDERIVNYQFVLDNYKEKSGSGYEWTATAYNSWLAHKNLFARHHSVQRGVSDSQELARIGYQVASSLVCSKCIEQELDTDFPTQVSYPCVDLLETAITILGLTP